jgi:hypothetical protein
MIQEIKGIVEGIANRINPKEESERIAIERLKICGACPLKGINTCTRCGCNLITVARATFQKDCPIGKWKRASRNPYNDGLPIKEEDNGKVE